MSVEHIHDPYFKELYTTIKNHHDTYGEVPSTDTMLSIGGICVDYINNLYQPENEASDEFIKDKVWEDHIYHEMAELLQTSADYVNADPRAGLEYLQSAISTIQGDLNTLGTDIVHNAAERLSIYKQKQGNSNWFYPTGFPQLDEKIGGFAPGEDLIVLFARTGVGKEQPLYSKVLTPSGWKRMGDLKLGEYVVTATGDYAPIIAIFPQGVKDVYRITFTDGSYIDAGKEHLWKVANSNPMNKGYQVVCTADLINSPGKYKIPASPVVDFVSDVKVHNAYICGYLLASYVSHEFYGTDVVTVKLSKPLTKDLCNVLTHEQASVCGTTKISFHKDSPYVYSSLTDLVAEIPETDLATRLGVLQGICKVNGSYNKFKRRVTITFETSLLGDLVCALIRSLGGTCVRKGHSCGKIYGYLQVNPFRDIVNKSRWKPCRNRHLFKHISTITLQEPSECQCIMVNHPDHTYISDSYTVTHNTWIMTKMLHESWKNGYNVGLIEPEMTGVKIGYRFDTINKGYSNRDLMYGRDMSAGPSDYDRYIEELPNQTDCKFMVAHPKDFGGVVNVSKLKSWCIRNDIKILGVDGISYMQDERGKPSDNATLTLTHISADLMELSIELGIPVIIVVQSNREGTAQGGKLALENIRDSDGIAYSASKVLGLYKKNEALHIQLLKNRDGESDTCLAYDWDINLGRFQFLQEGEVEGDNPETSNNGSRYSYNPQSNSNNSPQTSSRPDRMSDTHEYQNVTFGEEAPTALF